MESPLSSRAGLLLLSLVALLAGTARFALGRIDDAYSAREMRQIELTLATGAQVDGDRFLGLASPGGALEPAHGPRALARIAKSWLATAGGEEALRGVREENLELLARATTALAGAAASLLLFSLMLRLNGGSRRAAFLAAVLFALLQAALGPAVDLGCIGVCLALLAALAALRATEQTELGDAALFGLVGGVCAGLALGTALIAGPLVLAAAVWVLERALAPPASAVKPVRVGALCFAAATAVAALVESISLDGSTRGVIAPLSMGALGLAVVLYALLKLPEAARERRWLSSPVFRAAAWLAPLCAWWAYLLRFGALPTLNVAWLCVGCAAVAAAALLGGLRSEPRLRFVLVVALATWPWAAQRSPNDAWALPLALVIVCALAREPRPARAALFVSLAALVCLLPSAHSRWTQREARGELVHALRWMRANTPAPGPWNHPGAEAAWSVLCDPRLAPLVAYHARRRPLGATNPGRPPNDATRAAPRLLDATAAEAAGEARARDLRFAVLAPDALAPRLWAPWRIDAVAKGRASLGSAADHASVELLPWTVVLRRPVGDAGAAVLVLALTTPTDAQSVEPGLRAR